MFLDRKFGYVESLDYTLLPGFSKLGTSQKIKIHEAYERGYQSSKHMGIKIAVGTGFETAKETFASLVGTTNKIIAQQIPLSIFAGLENCQ